MAIIRNIADRKAAEDLHRTLGELVCGEVAKLPSDYSRLLFWRPLKESAEKNLPKPVVTIAAQQPPKPPAPKVTPRASGDSSVGEAQDLIESIEGMAGEICEAGRDFAEDVLAKAKSIGESVDRGGHATERQIEALENMVDGLSRWFHD